MQSTGTVPSRNGAFAAILVATTAIFIILTLLAGLPPAESMPAFTIGILILIAVTASIGGIGWYLLLKPLPAGVKVPEPLALSASTRSIIALLLTLGAFSIGIAGVWDEIWHSTYGIPFGEDFFWRPHLLLYFSFLTMIGLGGWSFWTVMTRVRGSIQQKFRANPLMGASFLGGMFTVYAVGADPIWHRLYGADIAPWSLPHLLILILILVMALLATAYHKTLMPHNEWRIGFKGFAWRNILVALVLVGALIDFLLIFTIQWYAGTTSNPQAVAAAAAGATAEDLLALEAQVAAETRAQAAAEGLSEADTNARVRVATGGMRQLAQLKSYPDWLLSVFLTFIATLFGTVALHTTRFVGTATLVGGLSLVVRFGLDNGFNGVRDGTIPLLIIIPLMMALDVVYGIAVARTGKPPRVWMGAAVVAAVLTVLSAPMMPALFTFMSSDPAVLPMRFIASFITGLGAIWLGQTMGSLQSPEIAPVKASEAAISPAGARATLWIYAGFATFLLLFIVTATPPV